MLRKITISAFLLILAYPKFNLWPLAWIAFLPFFFALENKNPKESFILGYLFGIVFFSGILYWLVNVSIPGTIALVLYLSLFPGIFCSFYAVRLPRYAILYVPAAWVFTEYLRAHLFTGFPWALLGYSQSFNLPMIQIADITGVYGVSFLVFSVNFALYLTLKKAPKRFYILFFIFLSCIAVFAYGEGTLRRIYPLQTLKVALIQGNIPQNMKWDEEYRKFIMDRYAGLTENASKEKPDLIIWPETSVPGYLFDEADLRDRVTELAKSGPAHLLVGTLREEKDKFYNSAAFISDKGEILKSYDKLHLVPFGEFIPLERFISRFREFIDKPIGDFDRGRDFTIFEFRVHNAVFRPEIIQKTTEFYRFASLICFEDIFPELSRNFVKRGADFLVNITNDAWFGKSAAPYQHMQGSIFRAVENRVPVLRSANTGVSCIIDHRGKVLKYVRDGNEEIFVDGYVTGNISIFPAKTFYTRFGDLFAWFCVAVVLILTGTGLFKTLNPIKRPVPLGKGR